MHESAWKYQGIVLKSSEQTNILVDPAQSKILINVRRVLALVDTRNNDPGRTQASVGSTVVFYLLTREEAFESRVSLKSRSGL
jgi:hypothetical protein